MGFSFETPAVVSSPKGIPAMLSAPWMRSSGAQIWNLKEGSSHEAVSDLIHSIITNHPDEKDAFYVLDLGVLTHLYERWTTYLPGIKPFYAVKCNPNSLMLRSMRALGANFDCASRAEIETIIGMGVSPDRIVFANPCKPESHIRYAASVGVNLTTYDSVDEVEKIKRCHPNCSLLLRLKAPEDEGARIPLGSKYGALPEEVVPLLEAAKSAGIPVVGVSFHVGSGMAHAHPYKLAIEASKVVFDEAKRLDMPAMNVLDIGGGFTAGGTSFEDAASVVRSSISKYFSDVPDLTVFGEPGRFFAETAFTLATTVIGKRIRGDLREYWLNDGIYGSMNCIVFDYKTVAPTPLACVSDPNNPTCVSKATHKSTLFGPTCDSLDTVLTDYQLPELEVNDWLLFDKMGAYTTASASNFNGFSLSAVKTHLAYSKKF